MSEPSEDLVPTPQAAEILGVPEPEFTRLAKCLDLEAARAGTRTTPRLWSRQLIADLARSPEAEEVRDAVKRKELIASRKAELAERYPEWRSALRPAALALFNFNRFSKWATCTPLRRRELYDLKDRVLRLFYDLGLAKEVVLHTVEGDDAECEPCTGTGKDWRGGECPTCAGTGQVRLESRDYLLFCFHIDGQWFNWHQPRRAVAWPVELTDPAAVRPERKAWAPNAPEKAIQLSSAEEFLDAEAVLRFVLKKHEQEKEEKRKEASRRRGEEKRQQWLATLAAKQAAEARKPGEDAAS